jgi:hypothetical protein
MIRLTLLEDHAVPQSGYRGVLVADVDNQGTRLAL